MADIPIRGTFTEGELNTFLVNARDTNFQNLTDEQITLLKSLLAISSGGSIYDNILSNWLAGAQSHRITDDDTVSYTEGFSKAVDSDDLTDTSTSDNYVDDSLTLTVAGFRYDISNYTDNIFNKILFLKIDIDTDNNNQDAAISIDGWDLLRVNTSTSLTISGTEITGTENSIAVNLDPENAGQWSPIQNLNGPVQLSETAINYFICQTHARPNGFTIVSVIYNGSEYIQCNNINVNYSGNFDTIGIDIDTSHRGVVKQFKTIENGNISYTHAQLQSLIENHLDEKWVFGLARLVQGSTEQQVDIETKTNFDGGLLVNGEEISAVDDLQLVEGAGINITMVEGDTVISSIDHESVANLIPLIPNVPKINTLINQFSVSSTTSTSVTTADGSSHFLIVRSGEDTIVTDGVNLVDGSNLATGLMPLVSGATDSFLIVHIRTEDLDAFASEILFGTSIIGATSDEIPLIRYEEGALEFNQSGERNNQNWQAVTDLNGSITGLSGVLDFFILYSRASSGSLQCEISFITENNSVTQANIFTYTATNLTLENVTGHILSGDNFECFNYPNYITHSARQRLLEQDTDDIIAFNYYREETHSEDYENFDGNFNASVLYSGGNQVGSWGYTHIGDGVGAVGTSGLVSAQRGSHNYNLISLTNDPTELTLRFDDSLPGYTIATGGTYSKDNGQIVLPAGHYIVCTSIYLRHLSSDQSAGASRVYGELKIKYGDGTRHAQSQYIRYAEAVANNLTTNILVRKFSTSGSFSVTGAVVADGTTAITVAVCVAGQGAGTFEIENAHIHIYRQVV